MKTIRPAPTLLLAAALLAAAPVQAHRRVWVGVGIGIGVPYAAPVYAYPYGYPYAYPYAYPYPWGYPVVVAPAPVAVPAAAYQPVPPAPAAPEPIYYPRKGQSPAQTEADQQACNRWAATQRDAMADARVFHRAVLACMDGRGYTSR